MPKLSQIIEPFANVLGVPARSVNVRAMVLRKAGLITKGGRGSAGAEMRASDCTNLLLSVMVGGESTEVDKAVQSLREAAARPSVSDDGEPPPVDFRHEALGASLDALFDEMIKYGDPINNVTRLPITNIHLEVDQPTGFGCSSKLWIDDGSAHGIIRFHKNGSAFTGVSREKWNEIASQIIVPGMRVTARVDSHVLMELARIIRGSDWRDEGEKS